MLKEAFIHIIKVYEAYLVKQESCVDRPAAKMELHLVEPEQMRRTSHKKTVSSGFQEGNLATLNTFKQYNLYIIFQYHFRL